MAADARAMHPSLYPTLVLLACLKPSLASRTALQARPTSLRCMRRSLVDTSS
jgi:hypothetical protein